MPADTGLLGAERMKLTVAELTGREHGSSFSSDFAAEDKVHIDGDKSIVGRVTGHLFVAERRQCEVSWLYNGSLQTQWIDEWRLSHAD